MNINNRTKNYDEDVVLKFINSRAIAPKRHSEGAAGYDICSIGEDIIPAGATKLIKTGFILELPRNIVGYICGRSGLAINDGIEIINSYVVNAQEVEIYLHNNLQTPFRFGYGTRIAQLIFLKTSDVKISENN